MPDDPTLLEALGYPAGARVAVLSGGARANKGAEA